LTPAAAHAPLALVAPDSFKGTFDAPDVARALAAGLQRAGFATDSCPAADGGEGTVDVIMAAVGGQVRVAPAHDPLGRPIDATFTLLGDGRTAVVETAAASGLSLLRSRERDPLRTTTFGTGELICAALLAGAHTVLVGVGGSATVDGGAGALHALAEHRALVERARLVVLCDVQTPWERCVEVYGPQKGATPAAVEQLRARLDTYARFLPRDPRGVPGAGAAGGLSGALWAMYDARLEPGAAHVLDTIGFDARLAAADVVVVGEGRIDSQSAEGKLIREIAARARRHGVPAHAVVGRRELDEEGRRALGLDSITEATTLPEIADAGELLGRRLRESAARSPQPSSRAAGPLPEEYRG
jgi:glycerate kinase